MRKKFSLFLALFAGLTSNTVYAATSALSTTGSWETTTGDLSSLLGQAAPATWTYDTDLSTATLISSSGLLSGGTVKSYGSSSYTLSGTAAPSLFDGNEFVINVLDNSIAAVDSAGTDILTSMVNKGLDPTAIGDALIFSTSSEIPQEGYTESFSLYGLMIFDKDFFSGSTLTIPTADTLLKSSLFTYALLEHKFSFSLSTVETGFASYAQIPSAVPVPAAAFMFAPALLGFLGMRQKTKRTTI